ncbi:MAG: hypothetical protein QM698_07060 [Micropepsaceae bacterium]
MPALAASSVEIELQGDIPAVCGVSEMSGRFDFQAALAGASQQFSMSVDCNVPYTLQASSRNGGLLSNGPSGSGVANKVEYDLSISVPTTGAPLQLTCASSALAGGECGRIDSGNEISADQIGWVSMQLRNVSALLTAGEFDDVIVVQVYPQS